MPVASCLSTQIPTSSSKGQASDKLLEPGWRKGEAGATSRGKYKLSRLHLRRSITNPSHKPVPARTWARTIILRGARRAPLRVAPTRPAMGAAVQGAVRVIIILASWFWGE